MYNVLVPKEPVRAALIGTGQRARKIYKPLFQSLQPWLEIAAVCDPVREHCDAMAAALQVPAYDNVQDLVSDGAVEAALIITPIESHHALSVFLSSNGIHNLTETAWCSTVVQARAMVRAAQENKVTVRVAENFFRFPIDRFARVVAQSGYLGRIGRIFSYNDHTGYHNNSRWIAFAGQHPAWVQSFEHGMKTVDFYESPQRFHHSETFRSRFFMFPGGLAVIDQSANIKGLLGRQVRPGFTEWHGEKGTLVQRGVDSTSAAHAYYPGGGEVMLRDAKHADWEAELRCCRKGDPERMEASGPGGLADCISEVTREYDSGRWARIYAETPGGTLEYVNPFRPNELSDNYYPEYGSCVMSHIVDFALAVRGLSQSEFDEKDALMSLMMEIGARESALQGGRQINLPLTEDMETDRSTLDKIRAKYGVDPLDIEAMMGFSFPKP